MQAERKRQASTLLETLKELCHALEIRPDSVEQRSCISLMDSAACVHIASLEKARIQALLLPAMRRPVTASTSGLTLEILQWSALSEVLEDWEIRREVFSSCCQGMQNGA